MRQYVMDMHQSSVPDFPQNSWSEQLIHIMNMKKCAGCAEYMNENAPTTPTSTVHNQPAMFLDCFHPSPGRIQSVLFKSVEFTQDESERGEGGGAMRATLPAESFLSQAAWDSVKPARALRTCQMDRSTRYVKLFHRSRAWGWRRRVRHELASLSGWLVCKWH